ncbi:hypothetical protein FIBSPDRAFT_1038209 [Athelia psychrophila]|uniref:DRBM domain-containing protein n=1 Tax=Athelia psychrophila TaxID=1759441 RepID=A0A166TF53_9AGAM|nr:hypothetical protein FIBSPDRAFT_1038209 [Fibularhizoctonia sp. CBS 109695]
MPYKAQRHSYRQELHNYLQTIYRHSNVLDIPAEDVGGGIWRADVLIYGALVAQATGLSPTGAREAAAARALAYYRGI